MIQEFTYGYLFKNNYAGEISMGEAIYNRSENAATSASTDEAKRIINDIPRPKLMNMSKFLGRPDGTYDPEFCSYIYMPGKDGRRSVFAMDCLRKSIIDRREMLNKLNEEERSGYTNFRGDYDLLDCLIFDDLGREAYAIDLMDQDFNRDIELTDVAALTEKVPEPYQDREFSADRSPTAEDLFRKLGDENVYRSAAAILQALEKLRPGSTLYLYYPPSSKDFALDIFRAALKLLPPKFANTISFMTNACAVPLTPEASKKCSVCLVPTDGEDVISRLPEARLITSGGGLDGFYTEFIGKIKEDVTAWCDFILRYNSEFSSLSDLRNCFDLYKYSEPISDLGSEELPNDLGSRIKCLTENYRRMWLPDSIYTNIRDGLGSLKTEKDSMSVVLELSKLYECVRSCSQNYPSRITPEDVLTDIYGLVFGNRNTESGVRISNNKDVVGSAAYPEIYRKFLKDSAAVETYFDTCRTMKGDWYDDSVRKLLGQITSSKTRDLGLDVLNPILWDYIDGNIESRCTEILKVLREVFTVSDAHRSAISYLFSRKDTDKDETISKQVRRYTDDTLSLPEFFTVFYKEFWKPATEKDCRFYETFLDYFFTPELTEIKKTETLNDFAELFFKLISPAKEELIHAEPAINMFAHRYIGNDSYSGLQCIKNKDNILFEGTTGQIGLMLDILKDKDGGAITIFDPEPSEFINVLENAVVKIKEHDDSVALKSELRNFRVDFVIREFQLLEDGDMLRLLKSYVDKATDLSVKDGNFVEEACRTAREFLLGDASPEKKKEFIEQITIIRNDAKGIRSKKDSKTAVRKRRFFWQG